MSKVVVSIGNIESKEDAKGIEQAIQRVHNNRVSKTGFNTEVYLVVTAEKFSEAGYGLVRQAIESFQEQGMLVQTMIASKTPFNEVIMAVVDSDVLSIEMELAVDVRLIGHNRVTHPDHHPKLQERLARSGQCFVDGMLLAEMLEEDLFSMESGKSLKTLWCVPSYYDTMIQGYKNKAHFSVGHMDTRRFEVNGPSEPIVDELLSLTDEIESRLSA